MLEKRLSRKIIQYLRSHNAHVQRVEVGTSQRGVPDIEFCLPGIGMPALTGWIELKVVKTMKRRVVISSFQLEWMRQRLAAGGQVWVLVWVDEIGGCFMVCAKHAKALTEKGMGFSDDPYQWAFCRLKGWPTPKNPIA